jgi:hypothetical protein
VKTVAGKGFKGSDKIGGMVDAKDQQLCSPWDIVARTSKELYIAIAGKHQIW